MTVSFDPEQLHAIEQGRLFAASDRRCLRLEGPAGSGKTTIAREVAKHFKMVKWCSFTGKAASVLRQKGCAEATTIHRLIYTVREGTMLWLTKLQTEAEQLRVELRQTDDHWRRTIIRSELSTLDRQIKAEEDALGKPRFLLNDKSEAHHVDAIGVDEASMVDRRVGEDLATFRAKLIAIYDSFQLPPVMGGGYFLDRPADIRLTQIHRQGQLSGILQLATDLREGEWWRVGQYEDDCEVVFKKDPRNLERIIAADQVIVGRNETRHRVNYDVRQALGFTKALPVVGDKVVCTKNDHDLGLLNGSMWRVMRVDGVVDRKVEMVVRPLDDTGAGDTFVNAWCSIFEHHVEPPGYEVREGSCFDFGYALTVHKAQGSQWGSVFMVEEGEFMGPEMWPRHAYTGITRAADRLVMAVDRR